MSAYKGWLDRLGCHIRRTVAKSSCFAAGEPRYASMGMPSQPGALLSCSTRKHSSSASSSSSVTSPSLLSSAVTGAHAAPGISAHVNFLPRNSCQLLRLVQRLAVDNLGCFPRCFPLPVGTFVSRATSRTLPTRFAASMSPCRQCIGDSRLGTIVRYRYLGVVITLGSAGGSIVRAPRTAVSGVR